MMNTSPSPHLHDLLPAVRLASGIEPQQKWPPPLITTTATTTIDATIGNQREEIDIEGNSNQPKLIEYSPRQGREGTVVTIVVQSLPAQVPAKLAFNNLLVETKQMQTQGITSLVATVPSFQQIQPSSSSSASSSSSVTISICFLQRDLVTETWLVSDFTYTDTNVNESKTSDDTNMFQLKAGDNNNDFLNTASTSAAAYQNIYSSTSSSSAAPTSYSIAGFESQKQPQQYHQYPSYQEQQQRDIFEYKYNDSQQSAQQYTLSNYNSTPLHQFYPPTNSTTTTSITTATEDGEFTNMITSALGQSTSPLMAPNYTMHQLTTRITKRASIPPRQSSTSSLGAVKSNSHIPTMPIANYQPYPGLVSRSNLEIIGDLESMTNSWSIEEWQSRRRLVQFSLEQQEGNKIQCTFQPISCIAFSERTTTKDIVVSCIYWLERNEYYITSVDTIYLLERLIEIKFSVEEKNRIRRNLEGFRPLTVSKCKPESAEFFKVIMSFPNPKPRHIEKDVKVFPWKTLPYALKKIVTKYTASSYNHHTVGGNVQQQQQQNKVADRFTEGQLVPFIATSAPINTATVALTTANNDQLGAQRSVEIKQEGEQIPTSFIYQQQEALSYARSSDSHQKPAFYNTKQFKRQQSTNAVATTIENIRQDNSNDEQFSLAQSLGGNVIENETSSNIN